jgi:hypothetical protein
MAQMAQYGPGTDLAAQCPVVPNPEGWKIWTDADGPVPDALARRAAAVVSDQSVPLGTTESYPLPGVTALIRVEPRAWGRDASGALVQGCFRSAGVYLPSAAPPGAGAVAPPTDGVSRAVGVLTAVSLAVGTVATIATLKGGKN